MRASTTLALIASLATLIAAAPVPSPPPGVQADTAAYFQGQLNPLSKFHILHIYFPLLTKFPFLLLT